MLRILLVAALPIATSASGCLHHHAVRSGASGLLSCPTGPGESSCFESSRSDDRGMLRHHVVERTTPGDHCDLVVVEQASFDADGVLLEKVLEDRRCGVVDRRVSTRYDLATDTLEHRVQRDENHDDELEVDDIVHIGMNPQVRALALCNVSVRMAHIASSMAEQKRASQWLRMEPLMLVATNRN